MVRIKIEEIVGLRAHKVIRGRGTPPCDADRLGKRVQRLKEDSFTRESSAKMICLL
jgi:hypothetical protein